ncbi:MAG: tetratricopeptide repeat protein, partial [Cyanobacteria bacterium P01_A01_bin.17]
PVRSQPSPIAQTNPQPSESLSPAATAEQIKRLDAAVLTVDDGSNGNPKNSIDTLHRLADAYSEIGEQARAIELLERSELIASENAAALYSYPRTVARIASYYSGIGEVATAQRLLEQSVELILTSPNERLRPYAIGDIAKAYSLIDDPDTTQSGLANLLELVTDADSPLWKTRTPFAPKELIDAYRQLDDTAEANKGLSKLIEIKRQQATATADGTPKSLSIDTLSQFATAYSQQGNTESAEKLLDQAMELVQNSKENGRRFYDIGKIAAAYGDLDDVAAAEQALADLTTLSQSTTLPFEREEQAKADELRVSFARIEYDLSALLPIAIAYSKLGNRSKAQEVLTPLTERFSAFEAAGILAGGLIYIEPLARTYKEIGDIQGQQAILQQVFAAVPALQKSASKGLNIADVTPGYLGIGTLVSGYLETEDDAIAQARLQILEDFFKQVRFGEGGFSSQLTGLASATIARGDEATAHRLMTEAMQLLGTPEDQLIPDDSRFSVVRVDGANFEQVQHGKVLRNMARNYGSMKGEQMRQAGLEATQQLAAKLLKPELRSEIDNAIVRAYAGI